MSSRDGFKNVYSDQEKADAYSALEFANTYYLAYRDLPGIIRRHVTGRRAVDFGCGAGRSTMFLKRLGFDVVGIDISEDMLAIARRRGSSWRPHTGPWEGRMSPSIGSWRRRSPPGSSMC